MGQYEVLKVLKKNKNYMTSAEISKKLNYTRNSIMLTLSKLQKYGFIKSFDKIIDNHKVRYHKVKS